MTTDVARNPQVLWVLKTFGWLYSAGARTASLSSDPLSKSAPLRRALLGVVCRYPEKLPGPLVQRQIAGAGTPGFAPRSSRSATAISPMSWSASRCRRS